MLRIALAQINTTVGDIPGNSRLILDYISKAREQQADLVAFPEMAVCGYPPEDLLLKKHFVLDNIKALKALAKKIKGITAIVGFVDTGKKGALYNAAAVLTNGRIQEIYHKCELPNYGVFDEKRYFSSGKASGIFSIGKIVLGVTICEDIWTTNGLYHRLAKRGAKVIMNISASPYHAGKSRERERLFTQKAKATKTYLCYVNLIGGQDELVFDGGSMIIGPRGRIAARGCLFAEDMLIADLDLNAARKAEKKRPLLPTKAPAPLKPVEEIYKALVLGTRDYVRKNGFKKIVVGLSGGIDSTLVALIAYDAVGKDNVVGISMPSKYSSPETKSDAKTLARNLGITFIKVPITKIFNAYKKELKAHFARLPMNIAEENIQARIRGNILMAFSNKFGWIVLTTGNKSEIAVGYCTLYGDMTGGFAAIKDVPKTKVYELVRFRNSQGAKIVPKNVFDRAPTAELKTGQTDQDTLPDYDVLDELLLDYVQRHKSLRNMKRKGRPEKLIKEIMRMVNRSEYKRRQSPPGIKITPRAFGKDWRLPITNHYRGY